MFEDLHKDLLGLLFRQSELNYPMGPFELGDLVGLDTRLNNLKYLHEKLGDKYRPAPLLEQYVKAGRLGRKTGRGVYEYSVEKEKEKST